MQTHEISRLFHEVEGGSARSFGYLFAFVFAVVSVYPMLSGGEVRVWALVISLGFAGVAWLQPRMLEPANRLWLKFGLFLGKIVTPIVLGIVFFGVVTVTGLIMRSLGKDLLGRRFDPDCRSYWVDRNPPGPASDSMENQF